MKTPNHPVKSFLKTYLYFFLASLLSIFIWYKFTYPQLSLIDLSVSRDQALTISKQYLAELGVNVDRYQHATLFAGSGSVDRFLQKALGYQKEVEFLKEHDLELFFWRTRFFRENKKEHYVVTVSAATGEITAYYHSITEAAARPFLDQDTSRQKVIAFLSQRFGFDPTKYTIKGDLVNKHDHRTNYTFTWEKNDVYVTWSPKPNTGGGQILTGAIISGDEILSFNKMGLDIPGSFQRHMARQQNTGRNLALMFRILYLSLLTISIFFVVVRRNNLVMHTVKRFCVGLTIFLFFLNFASYFNDFEDILMGYPTTASFQDYFWRHIINLTLGTFMVTIGILMPSLAGESLHYEAFPEKKEGSFLHYIRSTVLSRSVSHGVLTGYLVAVIMIGIQALAFGFGQRYLGVWTQYDWITQLSSSYWPFVTAFVIGCNASAVEEISFRLFSISLGKKFLKNTAFAVLLASLMWGYGHSTYLVFPMWFRGLEVTCLGIFLSVIYLRYGIIPVLVAHYLFDVFWHCSAYLFGKASQFDFYTSMGVLAIPMVWAAIAYIANRATEERPLRWQLNTHQIYNIEILKNYLKDKKLTKNDDQLTEEIVSHGWDQAVVEIALADLKNKKKEPSR